MTIQPPRIIARVVAIAPLAMGVVDAALYLGTSQDTIRDAIYREVLPAVRIGAKGTRWSILVDDLKTYRFGLSRDLPD